MDLDVTPEHRSPYAVAFDDIPDEITIDTLPVRGKLPPWLAGTLVRNGPGRFDKGVRHWFDGLAMLHSFTFADGRVSYANRFLDTPSYRRTRDEGKIDYFGFASDPCPGLFGRHFSRFTGLIRGVAVPPNVNVVAMGDRFMAVTETPVPVEFDPATLRTVGVVGYEDRLRGQVTTAHPHQRVGGRDLLNYVLNFGPRSEYRLYRQRPGTMRRELIGAVPVKRPAYMHSFGVTERYAVLAEFPLVVNPLDLLLKARPFIDNYRWEPERGTRFTVVDLRDGSLRGQYESAACFAFHHVNAFEDGEELVVDLAAAEDPSLIDALYLDNIRSPEPRPAGSYPSFTRHRIDLRGGRVRTERPTAENLELPRIAYRDHNGRDYGYAYGTSVNDPDDNAFFNQLIKLDVRSGDTKIWAEDGCAPAEPVFVPAPDGKGEDDGVALSVVLDSRRGDSFLLVLDAQAFEELARAEVRQVVPFSIHGAFSATRS